MNEWEAALKLRSEAGDDKAVRLLSDLKKKRLAWFGRKISEGLTKAFIRFTKTSQAANLVDYLSPHEQRKYAFEAGYQEGRRLALKEIKKHTNKWYDQKTFVIKTADIDRVRLLLETFGLRFKPEQHRGGPFHYSAVCQDLVLEIYPIVTEDD